jgi:hypothetical protein
LYEFYTVQNNTGAIYTIIIPSASTTYTGTLIRFRRDGPQSAISTIQFNVPTLPAIIPYNAAAPSAGVFLTNTQMSTTFICDGTKWYQMQTV